MKAKLVLVFALVIGLLGGALAQVQDPPQWNATTTFTAGGLVRGADGNYYRALKTNTNHDPRLDNHTFWELYYVRTSVTLDIATANARFSTLEQAWAMISSATIGSKTFVGIHIATSNMPFTENLTAPFSLDHTGGANITLYADTAANAVLNFPKGSKGFILDGGHTFGRISGITIHGADNVGTAGLYAVDGSTFASSSVMVQNFLNGVLADQGSRIDCSGSTVQGFTSRGVAAQNHSVINAVNVNVLGQNVGGIGFDSRDGSTLTATGSFAGNLKGIGFYALFGSTLVAESAIAESCADGYFADTFSNIDANKATSQNSTQTAFVAERGGRIDARNSLVSGTAAGFPDYLPSPNTQDNKGSLIIK